VSTQRQAVEDAIIQTLERRLSKTIDPRNGYLRTIGPYNGEIDESDGADDFRRRIRGQLPAVLVSAGEAALDSQSTTKRKFVRVLDTEIFCASNHRRSRENRLRADVVSEGDASADPGIYKIVEDIQTLISGSLLDVDGVGPMMPTREEVLLQLADLTVWRLTYRIRIDANVELISFGDQPLESYELNSNLDPDDVTSPPNPFVEADEDLTT
jgi:hypothetical protein